MNREFSFSPFLEGDDPRFVRRRGFVCAQRNEQHGQPEVLDVAQMDRQLARTG